MGYPSTQNMLYHKYLYESECCSVSSFSFENYHIFIRGLAKNTFTICNIKRLKPNDLTKVEIFPSQTTLTKGVLQTSSPEARAIYLYVGKHILLSGD